MQIVVKTKKVSIKKEEIAGTVDLFIIQDKIVNKRMKYLSYKNNNSFDIYIYFIILMGGVMLDSFS